MKKTLIILYILAAVLLVSACGKDSIAENDSLAHILGTGAAGIGGKGRDGTEVQHPPNVDDANMRSTAMEGVVYYKLVDGVDTKVDAGEYTVGMADEACSVTAKDASGNITETVNLGAQGDGSKGPLKPAAVITVPEGGSLISVGGTCIAQKR